VANITVGFRFLASNHTKAETHPGKGRFDSIMTEQTENSARIVDAKSAPIPQSKENADAGDARNFEKEVHTWNPTLPMWRRSNKE
jgi:hypothetical protein